MSSFFFYKPVFIDMQVLKLVYTAFLAIVAYLAIGQIYKQKPEKEKPYFLLPMKLVIFSTLFSIIPAYFSWGQSPATTFVALLPYLSYIFYFFLIYFKPKLRDIEKIIIAIGLLTLFLQILSIIIFPTILYGGKLEDEISTTRGFARLSIPGMGFIYLAYFLCVNKFVYTNRIKWLGYAIMLLIGIFSTLTRQSIAACLLLSVFFFLSQVKSIWIKIVVMLFSALLIYFVSTLSFVKILLEKTQEQTSKYQEDVRVLSGTYFLTSFSPDLLTQVFGNGEAATGKSKYGNEVLKMKEVFGYYQSDVGFIGVYAKFGLIGILAWILIFYRIFRIKLHPSIRYIRIFIMFFLLTGLTAAFVTSVYYIAPICLALYMADFKLRKKIPLPQKKALIQDYD